MKRKIGVLMLGVPAFTLVAALCQACFLWKYDGWICSIELGSTHSKHQTSVANKLIKMTIFGYNNCYDKANALDFGFFPSSWAMTKCVEWQNAYKLESLLIYFDRPIRNGQATLYAGGDLLNWPSAKPGIDIETLNDCKSTNIDISFSEALTSELIFEQGEYTATVSCITTDNKRLVAHGKMVFNR